MGHTREGAAPDALGRDLGEEPLDPIEPGRARRREAWMKAGMLRKPGMASHNFWCTRCARVS